MKASSSREIFRYILLPLMMNFEVIEVLLLAKQSVSNSRWEFPQRAIRGDHSSSSTARAAGNKKESRKSVLFNEAYYASLFYHVRKLKEELVSSLDTKVLLHHMLKLEDRGRL